MNQLILAEEETRIMSTTPYPDGAAVAADHAISSALSSRYALDNSPMQAADRFAPLSELKPGGWLLDEKCDVLLLHADPAFKPNGAVLKSSFGLGRVVTRRGVNLRSSRVLYDRLRVLGRDEVRANEQLSMGEGGSVEASLLRSNYDQLRDVMIEGGHITTEELEEDLTHLDDPACLSLTQLLWSAWSRRPSYGL